MSRLACPCSRVSVLTQVKGGERTQAHPRAVCKAIPLHSTLFVCKGSITLSYLCYGILHTKSIKTNRDSTTRKSALTNVICPISDLKKKKDYQTVNLFNEKRHLIKICRQNSEWPTSMFSAIKWVHYSNFTPTSYEITKIIIKIRVNNCCYF